MKKILHFTIAGLAWLTVMATLSAKAWTYSDGDVLLIFREEGSSDVEFDIGNISQFVGHTAPYTLQVTDWSLSLVNDTFGSVSGVSLIVASTTSDSAASPATWISGSSSVTSVSDVTYTQWDTLYSVIDGLGVGPLNVEETPSGANSYVIAELGDTAKGASSLASYYYIVTGGGVNGVNITEFGGHVPFVVEGVAPATLGFWQIEPNEEPLGTPQPEATYVGTFDLDANGNLYFYVGSIEPKITAVHQTGTTDNVSFTTLDNGSYTLVYSPDLSVPISEWTQIAGPVEGNGSTQTFTFTSPGDTADYYAVLRTP